MKNKRIVVLVFLLFLSVMSLGNIVFAEKDKIDLSKEKILEIEDFIKDNMEKGDLPGVAVAVVKGNKTIYQKGFGYADLERKVPINSKTLFEIGSNSKAFTALGILMLEKEGKISLNDNVSKYLPWLKVKYKGKNVEITLEQFLHHTSGIPFSSIAKIPSSSDDKALENCVKTLVGVELDFKPGEKYNYATINYDVLGLVIQTVTGKSYEVFTHEYLLNQLNLDNTYMFSDKAPKSDLAKGYKYGFLKARLFDAPVYRGNKPAGYIISCSDDMAKWLKIQMGQVDSISFDNSLIKKSHTANKTVAPTVDDRYYAGGWFVSKNEIDHGGNNPNYSSFMQFSDDNKIGIVVLCNTNSGYVSNIGHGINEILHGRQVGNDVDDLNIMADKVAVVIIGLFGLLEILLLIFVVKIIIEILNKQRHFYFEGVKSVVKLASLFLFMLLLSYCVYLIPSVLGNGLEWSFVFLWLPSSVKLAVYLVYIVIWSIYAYLLLVSLFKKDKKKELLILSVLSILSGFGNALIIFTITKAINVGVSGRIKLLTLFILGIILYVYGQKIMRKRLIEYTNEIVFSKRMEIVNKLLMSQYSQFEKIEDGRIQSTLNNDTEIISGFVNILISGITSAVTLICCFVYLGVINKYALLFSILIIVIISSIYFLVGRYANKLGEQARDLQNVFFKFISDLTGGFKELCLNTKRQNEFESDMRDSCKEYKAKRSMAALAFANMFVIGELLFTLAIGAIVFVFPLFLKSLDARSLISYVFILLYMTGPVHGILNTIPGVVQVKIALKRINSLIDEIDVSDESDISIDKKAVNSVLLKLKDVEYEYEKVDGHSFGIGPISFEFKSGEIVFITGGNGSGKSTLAKILTGLYKPSKGEVTLNGIVSQKQLCESYSTVFADFYLFDKLYGINYDRKDDDIKRYLEILELSDKVQIERGEFSTTKLSTGQKKRLALLVTYLEDRPIYLFDEWAADQDPEFRKFFYNDLLPDLKARNKCVIAITHDDRYFDLADRVIKMNLGKISI